MHRRSFAAGATVQDFSDGAPTAAKAVVGVPVFRSISAAGSPAWKALRPSPMPRGEVCALCRGPPAARVPGAEAVPRGISIAFQASLSGYDRQGATFRSRRWEEGRTAGGRGATLRRDRSLDHRHRDGADPSPLLKPAKRMYGRRASRTRWRVTRIRRSGHVYRRRTDHSDPYHLVALSDLLGRRQTPARTSADQKRGGA